MTGNGIADRKPRQFTDAPMTRDATPLLFGIIGPSSSGKTYSALRVAKGIQRVVGGDIYGIDTESNRMKHYADEFNVRHVPFGAPFSPLDYLDVINHCVSRGAKTIIVDSMSHEHEGPGGVLEEHDLVMQELMERWNCSEEKANVPAWGPPKAKRRRLINSILQVNANFIFCFRAKDKVKLGGGKVAQLGFMPIAGEEFVFELTAKCLLLPGAEGVPTWQSENVGEKMMMKLPKQFRELFAERRQLDEDIGQKMAEWAAGVDTSPAAIDKLVAEYEKCTMPAAFDALEKRRGAVWRGVPTDTKNRLKAASDAAKARLAGGSPTPTPTPSPTPSPAPSPTPTQLGLPTDRTPTPDEAMGVARSATSLASLAEDKKSVWALYDAFKTEVPIDVEAVFTGRRQHLEQQEEY